VLGARVESALDVLGEIWVFFPARVFRLARVLGLGRVLVGFRIVARRWWDGLLCWRLAIRSPEEASGRRERSAKHDYGSARVRCVIVSGLWKTRCAYNNYLTLALAISPS
jgi:hypothetical protein